ncbi:thioredoxin fold domain-containing protein [Colwellia psychrerythraea]|uniref:Thiol:disulfide interchange protein n=1 Tax=Colwellia psychrerythraea TaxID=28229 RepID=A0A099L672_COLPS|nr:thioredoxin fold domain-containing protein [Colwellia psychrerythraea]KGJ97398.1 Thioredoxin-like fold-containing protein [Colwellia psychrerythraea]
MKKIIIKTTSVILKILKFSSILSLVLFSLVHSTQAQKNNIQGPIVKNSIKHTIASEVEEKIRGFFHNSSEITITPYNQQLITVNIGARSFLASEDGRYIYLGKVMDTQLKIDISEQLAQEARLKRLDKFDESEQLIFPAAGEELFAVTLFTDIDCGYCRRFHSNMTQYNALGIRVNYLMLPRAGKNSTSYEKTVAVLCSANPQENMTLAMQGRFSAASISVKENCQHHLDKQMSLAAEFGISATPTMILANGGVIKGVLNPEHLLAQLKQITPQK